MSERERWIVYPLLFFALGAALRDKLTQRVESRELVCQSLKIVDPLTSNRILAELSVDHTRLLDSDGPRSVLRVNDVVCRRGVQCAGLSVVDAEDRTQALVYVGTGKTPSFEPGQAGRRVGAVVLKDSENTQVSELRADQFLGGRLVCNQIFVPDPENRRPLVYVGTETLPVMSADDMDPVMSHQGVIVLNNQQLGIRLAPPVQRRTGPPP